MRLYRLVKERHADDLSGHGAELAGGRWNRRGLPVIYTSESAAVAILETVVHCQFVNDLRGRVLIELEAPGRSLLNVDIGRFDESWSATPWSLETVSFGSNWLESNSHLLLRVPSSIVPVQYNVLINPNHRLCEKIQIIRKTVYEPDNRLRLS